MAADILVVTRQLSCSQCQRLRWLPCPPALLACDLYHRHSWPGAVVLQAPSVSARQASSPQCSEDPCPFSRGGNLGATVWELGTLIVPRLVTVSGPFQWTKVVCLFVCVTESVVNLYYF